MGSGRPSGGGRLRIEDCRTLDIAKLRGAGVLVNGWSGGWEWSRNGERIASISIRGGVDRITLVYSWRQNGSAWQDVTEPVPISWRDCRYGGQRPYFRCPGVVSGVPCSRTVTKLHCAGQYYLCRACYRLTYASRGEDGIDRGLRRANRIRTKLGGEPGLDALFPRRPKGMWHRTYQRHFEEVLQAESRADERLSIMAARLFQIERRSATKSSRGPNRRYWR